MKLYSWNVNGIRAALTKGLAETLKQSEADFFCVQETKARPEQVDHTFLEELGYQSAWNSAEKKGYSGTAIFFRQEPIATTLGIGIPEHDTEGRVVTLEYPDFFLVTVYTPNAQNELKRLAYRQQWDVDFREYVSGLNAKKPTIVTGDLNVSHQEIDLARPKANRFSAGFSDEERAGFSALLEAGFVDTFREFEKGPDHYSWWSFRGGARKRNVGWRLDYFCASTQLKDQLKAAAIHPDIMGSDHCPVSLELDL
ncbi:exodeoxyribonuclease III [Sulfuriroseicoccus oceanibius]|uniref:Exodeoxyribonuclease III n=1 Tax=Sulfuriroseicoccus oceanibius TaxID=2707525 RepID=A0A6B3LEC0_9BACT|nr:exodeoxyribonuclease III [Sulfuriroseicoccus oceanibius]QQL46025.1 exodeoxyribonuclease III [Sulfuriroseicoccus oceanibius]